MVDLFGQPDPPPAPKAERPTIESVLGEIEAVSAQRHAAARVGEWTGHDSVVRLVAAVRYCVEFIRDHDASAIDDLDNIARLLRGDA